MMPASQAHGTTLPQQLATGNAPRTQMLPPPPPPQIRVSQTGSTPPQVHVSHAGLTPPQSGRVPQAVLTPHSLSRSPLTPLPLTINRGSDPNFVPSSNTLFRSPWDQVSVAFLVKAMHTYDPEQHDSDSKWQKAWAAIVKEMQAALQTHGLPPRDQKEMMALWRELYWHRKTPSVTWEAHFDKYDSETLRMMDEVIQSDMDRSLGISVLSLATRREDRLSWLDRSNSQPSTSSKQVDTVAAPSLSTSTETSNDSQSGTAAQRKRPREAADDTTEPSDDRHAAEQERHEAIMRVKEAKLRALEDGNDQRDEMIKIKEKQKDLQKEQLNVQQAQLDMIKQLLKMTEDLKKEMRDLRRDVSHAQGEMGEAFKEKFRDLRHEVSHTQGQMAFMASMVPAMISGGGMAGRFPQPSARATPGRGRSPDPEEYCAPTAESPSFSKTPGSPPARRATRASTTSK